VVLQVAAREKQQCHLCAFINIFSE
jgi:hypothetical protein